LDCTFDIDTPFNGEYVRTEHTLFEKPTYSHQTIEGMISYWDGEAWVFEGQDLGGMQAASGFGLQLFPDDNVDWTHALSDGSFVDYNNVPLACRCKALFLFS